MMTRRAVLVTFGVAAMALLSGCAAWRGHRYHFRMTVEVETPQGLRSGSSVMEIHVTKALWRIAESARAGVTLRGEAVAVDLPDGRTLFALLTDQHHGEIMTGVTRALYQGFVGGAKDFAEVAPKLASLRETPPHEMASENYPLLVTFNDVRDPMSVTEVDPANLAITLRPGVQLRRITVAVTDVPITTGIEKRLSWLAGTIDGGLDPTMGVTERPSLSQRLSFLDFRRT